MATQVIEVELTTAPATIAVRADVRGVLVVVMDHGVPVSLARLPRPASGILVPSEITGNSSVAGHAARQAVGPTFSTVRQVVGPTFRSGVRDEGRDVVGVHPDPAPTPLSIIICTRERPDDLARCLESLSGARRDGHEVIVVDNAPVTDRTAVVAARHAVRRIVEPRPGLNHARNAGLAAASHDIVAYLDDDVVVSARWASAIAAALADPRVSCVTGLVLPLELETEAQEQFELYSQPFRQLRPRVYAGSDLRPSAACLVGIGANMAFRRDALQHLGGFDERLDVGTRTRAGGDADMFGRVLDSGRLIAYRPDAFVWHRHRRSARDVRACVFGYSVGTFAVLTKRLFEKGDLGALITAGRWLVGPGAKRLAAGLAGRPAPRWSLIASDSAGALAGPICFGYEAWRRHKSRKNRDANGLG